MLGTTFFYYRDVLLRMVFLLAARWRNVFISCVGPLSASDVGELQLLLQVLLLLLLVPRTILRTKVWCHHGQ